MKHSKWTKILVAAGCCVCAAGAGVMNLANAQAEELQGVDVSSFIVSETAQARFVPGSTTETGIRFTASMDKATYEALEELETTQQGAAVSYGMLIVPKDYIESTSEEKGAVTEESVFGQNAVYCVEEKTTAHMATCTKTHIARATANELTCESQKVNNVNVEKAVLRGSIINLKPENVHREFVGVAYIEYRSNSVTDYVFATADNARSMTYIAQKAIENNEDDATKTLYNTYVKPLEDAELKYTVEHWLPTGENGAYVLAETETKWGKINEEVSASNIAKTYSSYGEEWATAKMNATDDANVSGIVYVNGRTVLKCYYEKVNTTLFSATAGETSDEVKLMCSTNTDAGNFARVKSSAALVDDTVDGVSKKVLKVTSVDQDTNRDTVLDLQLLKDRLQDAADANWDYLTIKMKITAQASISGVYTGITEETIDSNSSSYNEAAAKAFATEQKWINQQATVELSNGTMRLGDYPVNEWVDVVIPKAKLNTAHTKNGTGTAWNYYSEYVGNKDNLTMENPAKTDAIFDTLFSKHGVGETTIKDNFLTTFTYWNKTHSDLKTFNNNKNGRAHDVEITCYVDSITWGIDYKAPTIQNVEAEACITEAGATTASFIPDYEVTDDILPQASDVSPCLIKSEANVYEVADGTYTLQTADENGVYTLNKNKTYKLRISAWDWSTSDIDGNKRTEEYDISIIDLTQTTFDFSNAGDMEYVTTSEYGMAPTEEYLQEWTGGRDNVKKTGVMRLNTSLSGKDSNGAGFVLNYNSAKAQKILDEYYAALADKSVDFELKITILFEFGNVGTYGKNTDETYFATHNKTDGSSETKYARVTTTSYSNSYDKTTKTYSGQTGILLNVGGKTLWGKELQLADVRDDVVAAEESKKLRDGEWYTLTFTEEILSSYCGWTNDDAGKAQALKELSGQDYLFFFSGNLVVNGGSTTNGFIVMPVTYFIDEISYTAE